ncbi:hypothetical protein POTOM_034037 [Populus tomentosa]|uniref:Uncharacterized protein n=1 Tax=Populus tomentosa TaxID=118781 RepID=A0A8X7YWD2_POPTO|nr:hypothetical protein POTOM_034037 [Populus tomentosa]
MPLEDWLSGLGPSSAEGRIWFLLCFLEARTKISDYTWVDSIADRESKTKYHSRSCRDPKVYLLRRKMDKRRKRAPRFYSHVKQSIHRPNPTPCASAVCLMQTRVQPSCDVTLHVAALAGQELVPRRKWDSVLSC